MNFSNDRFLMALLVASVLVNAFLIGFTISHFVRDDGDRQRFGVVFNGEAPRGGIPPGIHIQAGPVFAPDEENALTVLDRAFAPQRDEIDRAMDEMEANKMQVEGLLATETVDKAALDAALAKMRAADAAAFGGLEKSLRAAASMTRADRKTLVEALGHFPAPGPRDPRWMRIPDGPVK